jgi:8-oxo-dGTP diphosphatase
MKKQIHVAIGVIFDCPKDRAHNGAGNILIAKRADHQHQGGFWEFPGGKVEEGETVQIALQRELEEELGLTSSIDDMAPIMTIPFEYTDKSILLDVWAVYKASNVFGKEGQPLRWVKQADIAEYEFPPANQPIIKTLLAKAKKQD